MMGADHLSLERWSVFVQLSFPWSAAHGNSGALWNDGAHEKWMVENYLWKPGAQRDHGDTQMLMVEDRWGDTQKLMVEDRRNHFAHSNDVADQKSRRYP